jgi:hypothetical protein
MEGIDYIHISIGMKKSIKILHKYIIESMDQKNN